MEKPEIEKLLHLFPDDQNQTKKPQISKEWRRRNKSG